MKTSLILFGFLLSGLGLARAQQPNLDFEIQQIISNSKETPFKTYPQALHHSHYPNLLQLARELHAQVKWTPSVSRAVLELPYNESRVRVQKSDEFDGWFDEYTNPNLILIHQDATMTTLVHELRHALHLGTHGLETGSEYDRFLIRMNQVVKRYQTWVGQNPKLSLSKKKRIKTAVKRLVETFSEIIAHSGDYCLAKAFHQPSESSHIQFMNEYKSEFEKNYTLLSALGLELQGSFVEQIMLKLKEYWRTQRGQCFLFQPEPTNNHE